MARRTRPKAFSDKPYGLTAFAHRSIGDGREIESRCGEKLFDKFQRQRSLTALVTVHSPVVSSQNTSMTSPRPGVGAMSSSSRPIAIPGVDIAGHREGVIATADMPLI